jgi:hypothetical protein
VNDGRTEAGSRIEHARDLMNGSGEVIDILKREMRDDAVEARIRKWKLCSIRDVRLDLGVGFLRGGDHRRRDVDADDIVAESLQFAG